LSIDRAQRLALKGPLVGYALRFPLSVMVPRPAFSCRGLVDNNTRRAAWAIGKKNDRAFEAGVISLTEARALVLMDIVTDKTSQRPLVRVEQPRSMGRGSSAGSCAPARGVLGQVLGNGLTPSRV
jgi:hypothetical protein